MPCGAGSPPHASLTLSVPVGRRQGGDVEFRKEANTEGGTLKNNKAIVAVVAIVAIVAIVAAAVGLQQAGQ